jgi:thymidylate synthase (FAD)
VLSLQGGVEASRRDLLRAQAQEGEEGMRIRLLDHGYVELIEKWGSDERIIEAARMSTDKGFQGWGPTRCAACASSEFPGTIERQMLGGTVNASEMVQCPTCKGTEQVAGDEKLLAYLWKNQHATPFEMGGLIIEVQAPIFVFREWHRHRTQSYNELSARYTPLPDLNYVPDVARMMMTSASNKQAQAQRSDMDWTIEAAQQAQGLIQEIYRKLEQSYQMMLSNGMPKELARVVLPVGRYSRMRASANLRNWLAFLTLRMDPKAQWEIRQYANAVGEFIAREFPRTWTLFEEGRKK